MREAIHAIGQSLEAKLLRASPLVHGIRAKVL